MFPVGVDVDVLVVSFLDVDSPALEPFVRDKVGNELFFLFIINRIPFVEVFGEFFLQLFFQKDVEETTVSAKIKVFWTDFEPSVNGDWFGILCELIYNLLWLKKRSVIFTSFVFLDVGCVEIDKQNNFLSGEFFRKGCVENHEHQ